MEELVMMKVTMEELVMMKRILETQRNWHKSHNRSSDKDHEHHTVQYSRRGMRQQLCRRSDTHFC
jgi:hypothetical protein